MTQFFLEKRQRLLGSYSSRFGLASLALLAVILAACTPKEIQDIVAPESEPAPVTETMPPAETQATSTLDAQIPGKEVQEGIQPRQGTLTEIGSQIYFEIFPETTHIPLTLDKLAPFGLTVDGTTFDFVFLPQMESTEGEPISPDRLALRTGPAKWDFLTKESFTSPEGKESTLWTATLKDSETKEPILWYPADAAQISSFYFAPPSELAESINFDPSLGVGIVIPNTGATERMQQILSGAAKEIVELLDEHDLEPNFTQETKIKFMGVEMDLKLITDISLAVSDPPIREVRVSDSALAEYVARSLFAAYWYREAAERPERPTEEDFRQFMGLWAKAQETGAREEWEKIQFKLWANDLNDGNGFVQQEYTIWPFYQEEAPEGVRAIGEIDVSLVRGSGVENVIDVSEHFDYAFGTNLDGNILNLYVGLVYDIPSPAYIKAVARAMSILPWWLQRNQGQSFFNIDTNRSASSEKLMDVLSNGGLRISQ